MASLFRRGSRLLDCVNQTRGFVCVLYPEPARNPKIKHHCIQLPLASTGSAAYGIARLDKKKLWNDYILKKQEKLDKEIKSWLI